MDASGLFNLYPADVEKGWYCRLPYRKGLGLHTWSMPGPVWKQAAVHQMLTFAGHTFEYDRTNDRYTNEAPLLLYPRA